MIAFKHALMDDLSCALNEVDTIPWRFGSLGTGCKER